MTGYNESTGIYTKEWSTPQGILKIELNFKANETHIFLKKGTKISEIPLSSLSGIPTEIFNDVQKLAAFLSNSYAKLSLYNDGSYKIQINQRLLGGGNIETNRARLWPGARVPYFINLTDPKNIKEVTHAIAAWNKANTGFKLIPVTTDKNGYILERDYIEFTWSEGNSSCLAKEIEEKACSVCESPVGRQGGRQLINCDLSGRYDKGSIMHEIGHALGFYHEQQRKDRNHYVTINEEGNSDQANYGVEGKKFGEYDFKSIMHYYFFDYSQKFVVTGYDKKNKKKIIDTVDDYENPKMRINHDLPGEQYDQIVELSAQPNVYRKASVPDEELRDEHKHLVANRPYARYELWSGVLSVGDQQGLSEGDRAAAKHLADLGKQLNSSQPQQPVDSANSSYRPRRR